MAGVTDAPRPPTPGERRLDRPPSDRYRDIPGVDAESAGAGDGRGSLGRAIVAGLVGGLAGAAATVILGGVLGVSAGLLVVAAGTGWIVGAATRIGGAGAIEPGRCRAVAVTLAIVAVALGQLGLWLYARTEGGVLTLPDYLAQTFGLLVPLQAAFAAAGAWWGAR